MKLNKEDAMKPIILCCGASGRAVVYGRVEQMPEPGRPVTLHGARMVLYWSTSCGGLFGLAAKGPSEGTRITHSVEQITETVWQEAILVSGNAAQSLDLWDAYDG